MRPSHHILNGQYKLNGFCARLSLVANEIWASVPDERTVLVIGDESRPITFEDINPCCAVQTSGTEVLIGSRQGLFLVTIAGGLLYKVCAGEIDDVSLTSNYTAIAFDRAGHNILMCKFIDNRWQNTYQFSLQGKTQRECSYHTLLCAQGIIYIASNIDNKVLRLLQTGEYIDTLQAVSGTKGTKYLEGPKVCGVDSKGGVLISDCLNMRLLVYSPSARGSKWQEKQLNEKVKDIIIQDSNTNYILYNNDIIRKYKTSLA